jgi:hypothetical protein
MWTAQSKALGLVAGTQIRVGITVPLLSSCETLGRTVSFKASVLFFYKTGTTIICSTVESNLTEST